MRLQIRQRGRAPTPPCIRRQDRAQGGTPIDRHALRNVGKPCSIVTGRGAIAVRSRDVSAVEIVMARDFVSPLTRYLSLFDGNFDSTASRGNC
jgi:hypothetical protein